MPVQLAPAAAENVLAVVVDGVALRQADVPVRHAKQVLAGEIILGPERRAALAQIVGEEPPARAGDGIDADQVIDVERGLELEPEDAVVVEAEVLQRSQRVVEVALDEWQVEDRNVLKPDDRICPVEQALVI